MRWTVAPLSAAVERELEALPPTLRARMVRLMELVQNVGLENVREPHVKHIEGKLWELRAKAAEGIARGFYVAIPGRRIIVLHVFIKKSEKTPKANLALARERMKEVLAND